MKTYIQKVYERNVCNYKLFFHLTTTLVNDIGSELISKSYEKRFDYVVV